MGRAVRLLGLVGALFGMTANVAAAAAPEIERFADSGSVHAYPLWSDACGFPVHRSWEAKGQLTWYADGSVRLHVVEKETLTGPSGAVAIAREGYNRLETAPVVVVDEGAGTASVTLDAAYSGTIRHLFAPGDGRLLHEAGNVRWAVTLVLDAETGAVLSADLENVFAHGQHSQFFDDHFAATLCAALAGNVD